MSVEKRFDEAIEVARSLPPSLLSKEQKLKLFALFKQAEAHAPLKPAEGASELELAKWEAWNDVRSLSAEQAMRSYAQVIEGLASMLRGDDDQSSEGEEGEEGEELGQGVEGREGGEGTLEEEGHAVDGESEEEPGVEVTLWSTSSLTLAAGSTFDVPLNVLEPSRCSYSFSILSGSGPIGFSLKSAGGAALVDIRESGAEGRVDATSRGLLRACLDNSSFMAVTVTVKCRVGLEPLSQLAKREAYRKRLALRTSLRGAIQSLEEESRHLSQCKTMQSELEARLRELQAQADKCSQEIHSASKRKDQLSLTVEELYAQLRASSEAE